MSHRFIAVVGYKQLLSALLVQFSSLDNLSEILLKEETRKTSDDKMEIDVHSEDKMDIESKEGKKADHLASRKLLTSLVDYIYEEGSTIITQYGSTYRNSPLISPALKLLMAIQRDLVSNPAFNSLLYEYACKILSKGQQLLNHLVDQHLKTTPDDKEKLENAMKSSMIGVILQPLVVSLSRRKFSSNTTYAHGLLPHLLNTLQAVDAWSKLIPKVAEADQCYTRQLTSKSEKKYYVETKHPYPHGKHQLKQTVTIPGAEALCLLFDSKSRTSNSNSDVLQLFRTSAMSDPVTNKEGKALLFAGNSFPKHSIVVPGDTVTFAFSANTRYDPKSPDNHKYRWGFKCKVTKLIPTEGYTPVISHWLLEIENLLTFLSAKFAATLVEGETLTTKEKRLLPLLSNNILSGGLEEKESLALEDKRFLENFIQGVGDASLLYSWMEKQQSRRMFSVHAKKPLEIAERFVVAAILKQVSLVGAARQLAQLIKIDSPIPPAEREIFTFILQETGRILTEIQQKGQTENVWREAVTERQSFEQFSSDLKKEKLMDMCIMKDVEYDPRDEHATIERLYRRLEEEINRLKDSKMTEQNPYEIISVPAIDRSKLLLKMRPAVKSEDVKLLVKRVKELRQWVQASLSWYK